MQWILALVSVFAKGLEAWNTHRVSKLAKAEEKVKEHEKTIAALKARDSVTDDDSLLKPPSER